MKNTEKITNAKALHFILDNVDGLPNDVIEKLEKMLEQAEKKSANRKLTAAQEETLKGVEFVPSVMKPNTLYRCKDIVKLADLSSTQRATIIMTRLVEMGIVEKITDKGANYYKLIED